MIKFKIKDDLKVAAKQTLNGNYLIQRFGYDIYVTEEGKLLSAFDLNDQWSFLNNVEAQDTFFEELPSKKEIKDTFFKEEVFEINFLESLQGEVLISYSSKRWGMNDSDYCKEIIRTKFNNGKVVKSELLAKYSNGFWNGDVGRGCGTGSSYKEEELIHDYKKENITLSFYDHGGIWQNGRSRHYSFNTENCNMFHNPRKEELYDYLVDLISRICKEASWKLPPT